MTIFVHVLPQVATALDRKERLLTQLRSMNDEAEKCGPDGRKAQPSDQFRQAYAQVVMQLKQVRTAPHPSPISPPPPFPSPIHLPIPLSAGQSTSLEAHHTLSVSPQSAIP